MTTQISENENLNAPSACCERERLNRTDFVKQIFVALVSYALAINVGVNMSFSAIQLPQLNANDTTIVVTKDEASWIASLLAITLPFGCLLVGPLIDKFGRKKVIIFSTLPLFVSWLICALATHVWHLYASRIIGGFSSGLTASNIVYITEVAHPDIRGMLLNCNSVFVSFGILLLCVLGSFLTWINIAWVCCCIVIASFILGWTLPESPHWLISFQNDAKQAEKSLKWLYSNKKLCDEEFARVKQLSYNVASDTSYLKRLRHFFKQTKSPAIYKPTLIVVMLYFLQQISGIYVIIFYAVDIFDFLKAKSDASINAYTCLIILGIIRFGMSSLAALLGMKMGRRLLFFISAGGMCVCAFLTALYLHSGGVNSMMSIGGVLGYVCFGALGVMVIPWTICMELLPIEARGNFSGLTISIAYFFMSFVVKMYPYIIGAYETHNIFYVLALINLLMIIFVYKFMPETFRKPLNEILEYFK